MKKIVYIFTIVFFVSVNCLQAKTGLNHMAENKNNSFSNNLSGKNITLKAPSLFISAPTDYFRSAASGDWEILSTWESSVDSISWFAATSIPDALAQHVVIQAPDSIYLTASRTTTNLTIMPGAKMNAQIFTITVSLRFNLLGTACFYQGGIVDAVPGVEQVLAPASTYCYNGTQAGLNAALPEFGNLVFATTPASGGTLQNTNAAAPFNNGLVVRGDLTINLQVTRDISFATGSTVSRTHTIDGNLNIVNGNSIVIIQSGAAGSATTGTVNIRGNLNFTGGTLLALGYNTLNSGNAILNLSGNINNTGGVMNTGLSTVGLFTLNFVGTTNQKFNSTGTLINTDRQNVNINNIAGVTFNTPVVLAGNLNFVTGIIRTSFINLLTMAAGSTVTGASNSGFVHGPVKKIGNTDFTFPVGKTNFGYVPIGISSSFGGTANDEFTAEYMRGSARDLGPVAAGPGLYRVSGCDYWILDKSTATPVNVAITAYWSLNNTCIGVYIDNPNTLTIAHFNGTIWNSYALSPIVTGGSTSVAGSITWPMASSFSPFALGSLSFGDNPLPITINYFNGTKQNNKHLLNWKVTCTSSPSANLYMERSTDGQHFNTIYSIYATALRCQQPFSCTDDKPAPGVNYYRLRMMDAEGDVFYSSTISLINATNGIDILTIAPNPVVGGRINLKVSAAKSELMEIIITDIQGRIMQKNSLSLVAGFNSIPLNVTNLSKGTYQLFGKTPGEQSKILRFVVQ